MTMQVSPTDGMQVARSDHKDRLLASCSLRLLASTETGRSLQDQAVRLCTGKCSTTAYTYAIYRKFSCQGTAQIVVEHIFKLCLVACSGAGGERDDTEYLYLHTCNTHHQLPICNTRLYKGSGSSHVNVHGSLDIDICIYPQTITLCIDLQVFRRQWV